MDVVSLEMAIDYFYKCHIKPQIDSLEFQVSQYDICVTITFDKSPYTVLGKDSIIYCDTTDGDIIVNLPEALANEGRILTIKKIGTNVHSVTIDGFGMQTIDDQLTVVITVQYDSVTVSAEEGKWWVI